MSEKRDGTDVARRDFLKVAGLTAVTGGALAATGESAEACAAHEKTQTSYKESEHVKTYYKLARF